MAISPTSLPEQGFVRIGTVLLVFPISRSAFWAGVKSGKYPKPVKLSERTTAWRVEDIKRLLASYGPAANDDGSAQA